MNIIPSDPSGSAELALRGTDFDDLAGQLVEAARGQGVDLTGPGGLLAGLTRQVLQTALQAELTEHLGYDKHDRRHDDNARNGTTPQTVRTEIGEMTIQVPRDRAGTFEPAIVPKNQRRIAGFDKQVLSLYAKGMTTGDITKHLADMYGDDVSRDLVSTVTEQVVKEMQDWQSRPLDRGRFLGNVANTSGGVFNAALCVEQIITNDQASLL